MKKRIITVSLIVASLILLVSVGFAGWVITQNVSDEKTGNFEAYGVSTTGSLTVKTGTLQEVNNVMSFVEHANNVQPNIVFGYKDSDPAVANPWLTFDNTVNAASLVAYIEISYEKDAEYSQAGETFAITHDFIKSDASFAVDDQLVGGPVIARCATGSDATSVCDYANGVVTFHANGTIVLSVTYTFGSELSDSTHDNPYTYFNSKERNDACASAITFDHTGEGYVNVLATDKWSAVAQKVLTALDTEVEGLTFKVTIAQQ